LTETTISIKLLKLVNIFYQIFPCNPGRVWFGTCPLRCTNFRKSSQDSANIEEFLAGLRFEQRGKLEMSWGSLFLVLETIMLSRV
jgi:hypothetical protein